MPKISSRNLNLWYGSFQGLKNINLAFQEKRITSIIGPSGCGKSTLLRVFNRMNDLIEGVCIKGEVLIDGDNILEGDFSDLVKLRKKVGMVFQRPNPFPLSVYENIIFGLKVHHLVKKPEILLMDEPCSALDPQATLKIEGLMQRLKKDYTIVIVTHNMQQAARASDDAGFFLFWELFEFDRTVEMFTAPKDKRTEDYITGRYG